MLGNWIVSNVVQLATENVFVQCFLERLRQLIILLEAGRDMPLASPHAHMICVQTQKHQTAPS